MKSILFVCYGNICRSPMAEFVFKSIVSRVGKENEFYIASAATSCEEIGNPVYPPAAKKLKEHGIDSTGKYAIRLTKKDYDKYDLIVGMEDLNIRDIRRIVGEDSEHKIYKLLEFVNETRGIADPWYTRDFETAYNDIYRGCAGLFAMIEDGKI